MHYIWVYYCQHYQCTTSSLLLHACVNVLAWIRNHSWWRQSLMLVTGSSWSHREILTDFILVWVFAKSTSRRSFPQPVHSGSPEDSGNSTRCGPLLSKHASSADKCYDPKCSPDQHSHYVRVDEWNDGGHWQLHWQLKTFGNITVIVWNCWFKK